MNDKFTLKLEKYLKPKTTESISGRDIGSQVRNEIKDGETEVGLEHIEKNYNKIEVIIPETLKTINPSYFLGLFGKSVRSMTKDVFNEKYEFIFLTKIDQIRESLKDDIEDGIKRALKDSGLL